jgi:2-polyprenyl-3-methyl-5-hydroxy-6-metoxy-1,4-benzoquinol methylase
MRESNGMIDAVGWHSRIAKEFDAAYVRSPAFRERLTVWSGLIGEYADAGCDVLDAGCGSGVLSCLAARGARSVLGFDASPEMVELAETRRRCEGLVNATFRVARLEETDILAGRRFDLVLCSSVLEYVDDYWRAISWLAMSLSPTGVLVFSMPNGSSLYRKAERIVFRLTGRPVYFSHVRNVPRFDEVRAGLAARGLEVLARSYYAATPLLSPLARRANLPELADNLFVVACRWFK